MHLFASSIYVLDFVGTSSGPRRLILRSPVPQHCAWRQSMLEGFRKAELVRWAREHFEPGTTVQSAGLACFGGVRAVGCRHEAAVTGGGPGTCEAAGLMWVNTLPGNVKRSMDGSSHSIRSKCLAHYPAEFLYRFDRHYDWAVLAATLPLAHPLLAAQPSCDP